MCRWDDVHLATKVVVYRAFIVTGMFIQPVRLCCRSQVALVGPILRLSVPASIQVGRLLNRFDIQICSDPFGSEIFIWVGSDSLLSEENKSRCDKVKTIMSQLVLISPQMTVGFEPIPSTWVGAEHRTVRSAQPMFQHS